MTSCIRSKITGALAISNAFKPAGLGPRGRPGESQPDPACGYGGGGQMIRPEGAAWPPGSRALGWPNPRSTRSGAREARGGEIQRRGTTGQVSVGGAPGLSRSGPRQGQRSVDPAFAETRRPRSGAARLRPPLRPRKAAAVSPAQRPSAAERVPGAVPHPNSGSTFEPRVAAPGAARMLVGRPDQDRDAGLGRRERPTRASARPWVIAPQGHRAISRAWPLPRLGRWPPCAGSRG